MERCEKSVSVRGVAWSGGGREVVRVDVSADGGRTWITAELGPDTTQPLGRAWAWKQWEVGMRSHNRVCTYTIIGHVINA